MNDSQSYSSSLGEPDRPHIMQSSQDGQAANNSFLSQQILPLPIAMNKSNPCSVDSSINPSQNPFSIGNTVRSNSPRTDRLNFLAEWRREEAQFSSGQKFSSRQKFSSGQKNADLVN